MRNSRRYAKNGYSSIRGHRYPNSAESRYYLNKAAQLVLTFVTGTGLVTVVTFLLIL